MNQISFSTNAAKSGRMTLSVISEDGHEVFIHSRIHPENDKSVSLSEDFSGCVILLGLGLGYHVMNLNAEKIKELIVVEISEEIAQIGKDIVLENSSQKAKINFVSPESKEFSDKFWEQLINIETSSSFVILEHPASVRAFPSYYTKARETLSSYISKKASDTLTIKKFGILYFKNILNNMDSFVSSSSIECFKDKFNEYEAVIVSSGPSIDLYAEKIKNIESKVFVIAVDSALPVLAENKIEPDFVVSIDPQAYTWEHLNLIKSSTILIQSLTAYDAVKTDHQYFYLNSHPLCQIIDHLFDVENIDSKCGNVAGDAIHFAKYCGFRKTYITGIDSSFPFHEIYSRSSSYQKRFLFRSSRLNTLEKQNSDYIFKNSSNYKIGGINTRKSFINYKNAIEKMLDDKFVHISKYSLPLKNCVLSDEIEITSYESDKRKMLNNIVKSGNILNISKKKLNDFVMQKEVREELFEQSLSGCSEAHTKKLLELMKCVLV
ncbi:MAG TPA: DUF115 domain-containing protein [Spirochaetota bacterium]|nr:DUF115 domain-containing protein [Spirochaetota bacterium]HOR43883.1 DUF115 domain-containing protein [Spirochaetota bacterium]HPK55307.1 DUF115 domain-containing protein [Spirochaetota bacterium]